MKKLTWIAIVAAVLTVVACGEKKKNDNVIAPRVVKKAPADPIKMQTYTNVNDIDWIGRKYHVAINRQPSDSLPMVKDETGQKFVDNVITLSVGRADGSIFYSKTFSKASFSDYLDADYWQTGILEGFVFDKADGDWLVFAASVCHPQTDEYIPLVVRLSRMGELSIKRDSQDISVEADSIGQ
ncbi:MAG: DUF4738 domain-containing protein [Prevotella sp.]|nr:DUF4738 domain-containing protein [Prevotella sp.]